MTDACAIFKNQAAPAGINIEINKMPANQYWEVWDKAPWGYTAWTHRPLGTMVLGLAYRKGVPWNEVAYDNPAFDAALDDAEATLDVNERKKKMAVCQKILQDDAIIPQPFWRSVYKAANKKVKGLTGAPHLLSPVPRSVAGRRVSNERRGGLRAPAPRPSELRGAVRVGTV